MYIALNLNSELEKKKRKIYRNDNRLETQPAKLEQK